MQKKARLRHGILVMLLLLTAVRLLAGGVTEPRPAGMSTVQNRMSVRRGSSVSLSWQSTQAMACSIEVVDMLSGRHVMGGQIPIEAGGNRIKLYVADLPRGLYEIVLSAEETRDRIMLEIK